KSRWPWSCCCGSVRHERESLTRDHAFGAGAGLELWLSRADTFQTGDERSARGRSCSLPPGGASAAGILTQQLLAVLLACEDRHLHAPVQRTARLTLVRGDRLGLATARRTDAGRIDAEVDQVVARGCSTPLRQAHVVGVATLRVRVTDDQ